MSYVTEHLFSPPEGNFPPCWNLSPSIHCNFPTMSDFFQPYGNIFSRFPLVSAVIFQPCRTFSNHIGIYSSFSISIRRNIPTMSDFFQPYRNFFIRFTPISDGIIKPYRKFCICFPFRTAGLFLQYRNSLAVFPLRTDGFFLHTERDYI